MKSKYVLLIHRARAYSKCTWTD